MWDIGGGRSSAAAAFQARYEQTDKQTNRWTSPSCEDLAFVAMA